MDGAEQLMPPVIPSPDPIPFDIVEGLGSGENERSDWRPVPSTDEGNAAYRDRGELGDYATNGGRPWSPPSGVRYFTGYGGTEADLERGWAEPLITEDPAYQLESYKERSSQPRESDVTPGNVEAMPSDWEFRNRNRRSEGFLTRPRIPTERG